METARNVPFRCMNSSSKLFNDLYRTSTCIYLCVWWEWYYGACVFVYVFFLSFSFSNSFSCALWCSIQVIIHVHVIRMWG